MSEARDYGEPTCCYRCKDHERLQVQLCDQCYLDIRAVILAARQLRQCMLERNKDGEFYAAEEVVRAVEKLDAGGKEDGDGQ